MKNVSLLLSTLTISVLMTGCNIMKKTGTTVNSDSNAVKTTPVTATTTPEANATPVSSPTEPFLGEWSIVEVNGEQVTVNGDNHPKMNFEPIGDADGALMVIGFNGCNYLNGSWKVNGSAIEPNGAFISTLRSCPDAPYEFSINKALDSATAYTFSTRDILELKDTTGRAVIKLRRRNLSFLNGAWKVDTINGVSVPASADVKVVIDVDECKIHGNAGCNLLNGDVTVVLDKENGIEFKNLATTRMMCPDIETEQKFLLALEEVATASEGAAPNEVVMKDSQGKTVLTMHRISADELAAD